MPNTNTSCARWQVSVRLKSLGNGGKSAGEGVEEKMARVVARSRHAEGNRMLIRPAEAICMVLIGIGIMFGVRYYMNYRKSPGYGLQEYLGTIKSGRIHDQYALVSDQDKNTWCPTVGKYRTWAEQNVSYTTRIQSVTVTKEVISGDTATAEATISIRASAGGKELYQTGDMGTYTDNFTLRKGSDGHWKVSIAETWKKNNGKLNFQKATPNPPGDSF